MCRLSDAPIDAASTDPAGDDEGVCPNCDYDQRGLPTAHSCPECGFAFFEASRIWWHRQPIRKGKSRDVLGNWTVSETTLERGNRLVTDITDPVDANTNAETVTRNGLMQSARNTSGHTATFAYDDLGRQTTVQDPRHTGGSVSETHYDSGGRVDWTEDPANNRTTYAFDGTSGRLSTLTDARSVKRGRLTVRDDGRMFHHTGMRGCQVAPPRECR